MKNNNINDSVHQHAIDFITDENHPGFHDKNYQQRRHELFHLAQEVRLQHKNIPTVIYHEHEHQLWREIMQSLDPLHQQFAYSDYLVGKKLLAISNDHVPQLSELQQHLTEHHMGIVAAEGLLESIEFQKYISNKQMPCTLFLRHHSQPHYTPEPDMVHDTVGHLPLLTLPIYCEIVDLIGQGFANAKTEQELIFWGRLYWFIIEFSLIEEDGQLKIFGAGLFSSSGEMQFSLSDRVKKKPFSLEEAGNTSYNPNIMQEIIFVLPPLPKLLEMLRQLIN